MIVIVLLDDIPTLSTCDGLAHPTDKFGRVLFVGGKEPSTVVDATGKDVLVTFLLLLGDGAVPSVIVGFESVNLEVMVL